MLESGGRIELDGSEMRLADLHDFFLLYRHVEAPWAFLRLRKSPPAGPFHDVRLRAGGALHLRPGTQDRHIFLRIFARDEYRLARLPRGSLETVIDIGAHIGIFAVRVAPLARRIISFEPDPGNFRLLLQNVSRFPCVLASPRAIAGRRGTASLFRGPDPSAGTIVPGAAPLRGEGIPVECLSVADVFQEHRLDRCDLLKLDCEGAEYEILEAVPPDLWRRIERVSLEYHPAGEGPRSTGEGLLERLAAAGFRTLLFPRRKRPRSGHLFAWREGPQGGRSDIPRPF